MMGGIIMRFVRMKKKNIIICLFMLVLQFLSVNPAKAVTQGNTPTNVLLGGGFVQNDNWIYTDYSVFYANQYGLCKFNKGKVCKLTNETRKIQDVNVINGFAYYTVGTEDSAELKRCDTNGRKETILYDKRVINLVVTKHYIFFVRVFRDSDLAICRMNLNGKNFVILKEFHGLSYQPEFAINQNKIYYCHSSTNDNVYVMNFHGKTVKEITNIEAINIWHSNFTMNNNYIFVLEYQNFDRKNISDSDRYLYRLNHDGSGKTKIISEPVFAVQPTEEWIYLLFRYRQGLFRINKDGKNLEQIGAELPGLFYVTKDYIIGSEYSAYIMRLDGKSKIMTLKEFAGIKD